MAQETQNGDQGLSVISYSNVHRQVGWDDWTDIGGGDSRGGGLEGGRARWARRGEAQEGWQGDTTGDQ